MTVLLVCLLTKVSLAHQQREAYTTVVLNNKNATVEVMHRVLLHDAEHIFPHLVDYKKLGLSLDLLSDKRSQRVLADYIKSSFALADGDQKPLPLNLVGFEVEGKFLWVYQESSSLINDALFVKYSAMQEFWSDHINHINVESGREVQSIRLEKSDINNWQLLTLTKPRNGG